MTSPSLHFALLNDRFSVWAIAPNLEMRDVVLRRTINQNLLHYKANHGDNFIPHLAVNTATLLDLADPASGGRSLSGTQSRTNILSETFV